MKKKICMAAIASLLAFSSLACGGGAKNKQTTKTDQIKSTSEPVVASTQSTKSNK